MPSRSWTMGRLMISVALIIPNSLLDTVGEMSQETSG